MVQRSISKVLMTTRKQKVASMGFAFELGRLSTKDGWELLKIKAFPYNDIPAHGMISHEHRGEDETLSEIAETYLNELVSRCLVAGVVGTPNVCQLHDAVRELCLSEGKNEGFNFHVMNYRGGEFSSLLNKSLSDNKARYLAIHFEGQMTSKPTGLTVHREESRKHIRSLQLLNREQSERIELGHNKLDVEKFELLRALFFTNFRLKGRQLKAIGNLIHLRILALKGCELDELPSSIRNLKYLHTLDLYNCWNVKVSNVLKEMHRLKILVLPHYDNEWVAKNKYRLTLKGLDELEKLYNCNSLVHDWKSIISMRNLLHMDAEIYDNESLSVVVNAIITNRANLRNFVLHIKPDCDLESTEDALVLLKSMFSCQTLTHLVIRVPIKKLQLDECVTEISTSRLGVLILNDSEIENDPMQILGKFPFLEYLYLQTRAFVGEKMKCHASGFPRLKTIGLDGLPNLREWTMEQGAMPLLSLITIKNCRHLEKIPDGLKFTRNLQELKIIGMPEFENRIDAEVGEDFDKVRHVPSIIIA